MAADLLLQHRETTRPELEGRVAHPLVAALGALPLDDGPVHLVVLAAAPLLLPATLGIPLVEHDLVARPEITSDDSYRGRTRDCSDHRLGRLGDFRILSDFRFGVDLKVDFERLR